MDDSRHIKSKQYHNPVVSNFKSTSNHMINLEKKSLSKSHNLCWISLDINSINISLLPSTIPTFSTKALRNQPVATNRKGHSVSRTGLIAASQVRAVSNLSSRGFGVAWHVGAQKKNTEPHRRFGAHYRDSCRSTYCFFGGGARGSLEWNPKVIWFIWNIWYIYIYTSCLVQ